MPDAMAFFFIDECQYAPLDLMALTGILVPLSEYCAVRDAVSRILYDALKPSPGTFPPLQELHARDLLPSNPDDAARFAVFESAARIVNGHHLRVSRVAYLNRNEIASRLPIDPKLYGLIFFGILAGLQAILSTVLVVPVIDGIPGCVPGAKPPTIDPQLIRAFGQSVRGIHHLRAGSHDAQSFISIDHAHNLAEPMFADSEHCTLLQLVDLISHLLLQLDRDELEPHRPVTRYRSTVLQIARSLDPALLHLWKGKLQTQSSPRTTPTS